VIQYTEDVQVTGSGVVDVITTVPTGPRRKIGGAVEEEAATSSVATVVGDAGDHEGANQFLHQTTRQI